MNAMSGIYSNPFNLAQDIIAARLLPLDPNVGILAHLQTTDADNAQFVVNVASNILTDAQVNGALGTPATAQEVSAYLASLGTPANLYNLPIWATWSPSQAKNYVLNGIFNGWTQAQVDNYIDTTATSLAGVVTVLHQIGAAIVTVRTILMAIAAAVAYIRKVIINAS